MRYTLPYKLNVASDRWAYENAERRLITRDMALRESVVLGELIEKDIEEEEVIRVLRENCL